MNKCNICQWHYVGHVCHVCGSVKVGRKNYNAQTLREVVRGVPCKLVARAQYVSAVVTPKVVSAKLIR